MTDLPTPRLSNHAHNRPTSFRCVVSGNPVLIACHHLRLCSCSGTGDDKANVYMDTAYRAMGGGESGCSSGSEGRWGQLVWTLCEAEGDEGTMRGPNARNGNSADRASRRAIAEETLSILLARPSFEGSSPHGGLDANSGQAPNKADCAQRGGCVSFARFKEAFQSCIRSLDALESPRLYPRP